jgi:hypothetical protein
VHSSPKIARQSKGWLRWFGRGVQGLQRRQLTQGLGEVGRTQDCATVLWFS